MKTRHGHLDTTVFLLSITITRSACILNSFCYQHQPALSFVMAKIIVQTINTLAHHFSFIIFSTNWSYRKAWVLL